MLLFHLALDGIAVGLLYGLAGMAFGIIFRSTRIFDISIGATYIVGAYVYYSVVVSLHLGVIVGIVLAIVAASCSGLVFYGSVYRVIDRKSKGSFFTYFVASFGVLTVVSNALELAYGSSRDFVQNDALRPVGGGWLNFPKGDIIAVVVSAVLGIVLFYLLRQTHIGTVLRALSENRELADVLALGRSKYYIIAFLIASAVMSIVAIVFVNLQGIEASDGLTIVNLAIAAMLVGGLGSYGGAMIGGILLGVVSTVAEIKVAATWQLPIAFGLLLVVLLLRPGGIFSGGGRRERTTA